MAQKSMIRDLTTGKVAPLLVRFSFPFMLSNLLQTVYNMVDMAVIGQFDGSEGLAAVSIGGDITLFITFICMGLAMAGQIMISQYIGRKDIPAVSRTIGMMFTSIFVLSIIVMIVGFLATDKILELMNTPAEAFSRARDYTLVCFAGTVFIYGYNTVSSILRGMGDSKHPLIFIAIAAAVNLVLDLIFVAVLDMSAFGTALATVIGQAVSFIFAMLFLYRRREAFGFDFKLRSFAVNGRDLKSMLRLGLPMTLQFAAISFSSLFVSSFINAYGVIASAVTGVGNKIGTVCNIFTNSLNSAGASMIGQSFGAGKIDRVRRIVHTILVIGVSIAVVLSILMILMPEQVFGLFNSDPEVLAMSHDYVIIAVLCFFGFALRAPFNSLVNGIGYATFGLIVGLIDGIVSRVGLAILLGIVLDLGIQGFWFSSVIAGLVPAAILGCYYLSGRWKNRKLAINTDN